MKEYPAVYVNRHEDKDEPKPYGIFEVLGGQLSWYAVDGGQLVMPVRMLEKDGQSFDGEPTVLLKQYGGDRLARSILQEQLEPGDRFEISESNLGNFELETVPSE